MSISLYQYKNAAMTQVQNKILQRTGGTVTQGVALIQLQKSGLNISKKKRKKIIKSAGKKFKDVDSLYNATQDATLSSGDSDLIQKAANSNIDFGKFLIPALIIGGIFLLAKR